MVAADSVEDWKAKCLERDHRRCVLCSYFAKEANAHVVCVPVKELSVHRIGFRVPLDTDDGVTLCRRHYKEVVGTKDDIYTPNNLRELMGLPPQ